MPDGSGYDRVGLAPAGPFGVDVQLSVCAAFGAMKRTGRRRGDRVASRDVIHHQDRPVIKIDPCARLADLLVPFPILWP